MDFKSWILIGGGILLVGVVAHGFWLQWRNRRDTLRLDIDRNIPREDVDELALLRGELPNGGARLAGEPAQGHLDLETEAPVLMEQAGRVRVVEPTISEPIVETADTAGARKIEVEAAAAGPDEFRLEPEDSEPLFAEPVVERSGADTEPGEPTPRGRSATSRSRVRPAKAPAKEPVRDPEVEEKGEIIVINVLARDGASFPGEQVLEAFLRNGLKFGDMNIFHRVDPTTKTVQFSVASAVEPGTFDLSAMAEFTTRGVTMFLRLPGPHEPLEAFDDMLNVARDIASSLGGDLKDEQLSVMTGQTSEHCRQRIAEFSRKRMSQRA
jgi:cell division protein ZipA